MRRALLALVPVVLLLGLSTPVDATPSGATEATPQPTVVSLTFDGTYRSQVLAADILADNGLAGTFYVNSGYLDYPGYLSVDRLRAIARSRNEVGGASLFGNNLADLTLSKAKQEVCDDRATLAQLGFQVTSFAYPYGDETVWARSAARDCGYNSARAFAGLYASPTDCSACPDAESLDGQDDFRIRTAPALMTLDGLKSQVVRAESSGGGWLPLVFNQVCVCPLVKGARISPGDFSAFVEWLKGRPGTMVSTVDQVIGGEFQPVIGKPLRRLVPDPSTAISKPQALSRAAAWTVFGIKIGQAQILFAGVAITLAIVVTFRIASRENRYAR